MSTINTGGPAFPMPGMTGLPNGDFVYGDHGMTLRDYFAAKALQGFLAHPEQDYAPLVSDKVPMIAREAYAMADAMLVARESGGAE